jgi:hypothetical protein
MKRINKYVALAAIVGFLLGAIWLVALRYITYQSDNVHYHANFALYINGQRDEFKSFTFYEEVQACTSDNVDNPKTRVHLHNQDPALIHIHAHGVTWGQFFDNLGYTLGDTLVKTDKGVYVDGQDGNELTFWLNGKPADAIANTLINSEDRLLINYGKDDQATLQKRYDDIPKTAGEANTKNDPATCSGDEKLTPSQRLKKSLI